MRVNNLVGLCFLLLLSNCQTDTITQEIALIQSNINQLKAEFAPDKRVAIWDILPKQKSAKIILAGQTNLPAAKEALIKAMEESGLEWVDSIQLLPDPNQLGEEIYGIVNLSACNIRSQAKHSGELATQSTLGTTLKVYDQVENWYRVQTPDGYLGWLDAGGFTLMNMQNLQNWKMAPKVIYLAEMGFAYEQADTESRKVSDLLAGNILRKGVEKGAFTQVIFPDGRIGYAPKQYLMDFDAWLNSRNPTVPSILADAQEMLGRPYLWGGTSGKAFDCSGFTKTVFFLNGLILPRDASQQVHVGKAIEDDDELSNLQAGDLLFFGRAATEEQKEKITHVAIYMGNGKMIHATGQVKIESLNPDDPDFAPERLKTFVRAKRMLDSPNEHGIPSVNESEWYIHIGEST